MTGASSGIGEAYAEKFAMEGNNLILAARRMEPLNTLTRRLSDGTGIRVTEIAPTMVNRR